MTSSNMPSSVPFKTAFAPDSSSRYSIGDNTSSYVNFADGFPANYEAPTSSTASDKRYVTRKEMNGLGYAATANQYYWMCGGLNTFDASFASKIGGYPQGAVLKYLNGTNIFDVISLVDDNTVDFTDSSIGIDGVNWAYLNYETGDPYAKTPVLEWSGESSGGTVQLGTFTATKSGQLFVQASPSLTDDGEVTIENPFPSTVSTNYWFNGCGLVVGLSTATLNAQTFLSVFHAIGIVSMRFGQLAARLVSTSSSPTYSATTTVLNFSNYTLTKGTSYSVYMINSPEFREASKTFSTSGSADLTGHSYTLSGTLKLAM